MLKKFLILAVLLVSTPVFAQSQTLALARAVTACGGQSLTNGNTYPVTQDLTGKLCDGSGGGTTSSNITQFGGTNISTGTGVGGLGIPRVTVSSDSFPATYAVTQSTSPWVISGTVAVTQTTSPWVVSGNVNATLSAETTKVIGTVNQGTSPWVISGALTANQSVNVAQVNGVTTLTGTGAVGTGAQRIAVGTDTATIAGSAPGTAGTASSNVVTVQGVASMTPIQINDTPATSGGLSVYFVQPTASDNHVNIKNGAGQVYKISVTNNSATVNYLRLYNAGTGFNGCNSATNLVYAAVVPASTSGAGILDQWPTGMAFSTGISICVTSGYATNDTTNATATAMNVNIGYK